MRRVLTAGLITLGVVFGTAAVAVVTWTVDASRHDGEVARNVTLAGRHIGGMTRPQVESVVRDVVVRYDGALVEVRAPKSGFTVEARTLGLSVSPTATVEAAFDVGRDGTLSGRVTGWLRSFVSPRRASVEVTVAPAAVYRTVVKRDPGPATPATEPSVRVRRGRLVAVEGTPGTGIDPADVIRGLPDATRHGRLPIRVTVPRGKVQPRFSLDDAEALAAEGERLATSPLPVKAGDVEARVPTAMLRDWMQAVPGDADLDLALDGEEVVEGLARLAPEAGTPPVETSFTVVDDRPRIVPGKPGTGCCASVSAELVLRALRTRPAGPTILPLRRVEVARSVEEAEGLGIEERVGAFTTTHKAGEPRVQNIHRIAELVRGAVIEPGKTFSVNDFVGKRTVAKGFVVAPVIENGVLATDVGGGVSQFATTLFNAAFFAGLDFGEYQSHSLLIDRYPRGREATMGYPHPDLEIKNTTSYGVLIWPTYTANTITVTLYSTHFVDAQQTGQTEGPRGPCTRVVTERTRRYLDGTVKTDKVYALYRPEEGVNCF